MRTENGNLFLVPTPIGNLGDITPRMTSVLKTADIIFCEDTRVTNNLLRNINISNKRLVSYNNFNEHQKRQQILDYLQSGLNIALVSDAGTPLISDPGYLVVKAALASNLKVIPLPGPSAVMAALVGSGFNPANFTFKGFLNKPGHGLRKDLMSLKNINHPIVIFESPLRIVRLLQAVRDLYPTSEVCVAKELTKIHEKFFRGTAGEVLKKILPSEQKGEFVLIIADTNNIINVKEQAALDEVRY